MGAPVTGDADFQFPLTVPIRYVNPSAATAKFLVLISDKSIRDQAGGDNNGTLAIFPLRHDRVAPSATVHRLEVKLRPFAKRLLDNLRGGLYVRASNLS